MTIPRTQRALSLLLSLLLLFSFAPTALADDDTASEVTSISFRQGSSLDIAMRDTGSQLEAVVDPTVTDTKVDWTMEPEDIIDLQGGDEFLRTVKPLRPGVTTVTIKSGNKTASCKVTVSGIYIPEEKATIEMFANESVAPPTTYPFGGAQKDPIQWKSSDPRIADYSANRFVAYQAGKVTFTAEANGRHSGGHRPLQ